MHIINAATPQPRTTKAREPGKSLAAVQLASCTAHRSVRAGENTSRPAENFIGQTSIRPTSRPTVNPSGPDRSDSATTRLSGRSSRTTVPTPRSTRSPFEAQFHIFKPGLTLSRPRRPSTIYIDF
ncbi:unnamed protein product [Microthlaspi erraticum]|uniref:Uncharacterized protein n=1 Tax=Microthlaspi erraticum TaxID=1685480 RepID=A0A6D2JXV6_9BRAS|nr:unnamed protein product [Microthlaspi erraticum]